MCERYEKAYSWVLENIRQVEPFPVKGQLGIYRVDVAGRCYMNGESLLDAMTSEIINHLNKETEK